MSTAIEVPQEILDAVAEAESTTPEDGGVSADVVVAVTDETPAEEPAADAPAETQEPEPAADAAAETDAATEAAPEAEEPPAETADEEVSLEAILQDLKRREGRNE
jgi:hypothetical protein